MVRGLTTTRGTIGLRTTEVKEPRHGQDSLGILKEEHECFNNWATLKGQQRPQHSLPLET